MSIDCLVVWPINSDYPLWRQRIRDNRKIFNKVIVVFMNPNAGLDYSGFVRKAMGEDNITFVDPVDFNGAEDWRNVLVNEGLKYSSDSEWIYFTEQDFFEMDGFWETVLNLMGNEKVGSIGVKDGDRLHPCCLFVRRHVLSRTNKEFGAKPPRFDHFGQIQRDLEYMRLENEISVLSKDLYYHMAGLSHNMRLVFDGLKPNHDVEGFYRYLRDCLGAKVPLHPTFKKMAEDQVGRV